MKKIVTFLRTYLFYKSRLRNRVVFYFCIIAIAPLLMMGLVAMSLVNSSHNYDVSQLESQILNQKVTEIEKFFGELVGILEIRVSFEESAAVDAPQQEFLSEELLKENRAFEEITFINLEGMETSRDARSKSNRQLEDVSNLSYFTEALQGNSYVSPVFFSRVLEPRVNISAPVKNRNGEIIQVIAAEVSLSAIQHIISQVQLGTLDFSYVVGTDGAIIAHSRSDIGRIGERLSEVDRVAAVLQGQTFTGFGKSDRYESYFSAIPVVGAAKKIPDLGWGIFVEWPIAEADILIDSLKNQLVKFAIYGILGAFLLSNIFAYGVIRPIRTLEDFAKQVGKGIFNKRVQIKTKDELEELGLTLNKMAHGLLQLKKLKDEFVFIAAHELQTPVTAIRGYVSLIFAGTAGPIDKKLREFLEPVKEANDRLIQLINDLLVIARNEAGRIKVIVEPIQLFEVVQDVQNEVIPMAREKGVTVTYKPLEQNPLVLADKDKLKAVIANLVSNAIKYNRKDAGKVVIFHELKKNTIVTHIEDNGMGIPKEYQKSLFEKFFRVKTEKTVEITGTGLGLFIVKESVLRMGGRIWFVSEEGKGSTFSFELKRAAV